MTYRSTVERTIVRDRDGLRVRRLILYSGRVLYDVGEPLGDRAIPKDRSARRDDDATWWLLLDGGLARQAIARIFPTAKLGDWSPRNHAFWAAP